MVEQHATLNIYLGAFIGRYAEFLGPNDVSSGSINRLINGQGRFQRKIRTHLDLLSIPQSGGKKCHNV